VPNALSPPLEDDRSPKEPDSTADERDSASWSSEIPLTYHTVDDYALISAYVPLSLIKGPKTILLPLTALRTETEIHELHKHFPIRQTPDHRDFKSYIRPPGMQSWTATSLRFFVHNYQVSSSISERF